MVSGPYGYCAATGVGGLSAVVPLPVADAGLVLMACLRLTPLAALGLELLLRAWYLVSNEPLQTKTRRTGGRDKGELEKIEKFTDYHQIFSKLISIF